MTLQGKDLYAALMHELKNNLGLLSMTIDGIPLVGEDTHDGAVNGARMLCQQVIDRLQQALLVYKANERPIEPSVDAYSPADLVNELKDSADSLARGRLQVDAVVAQGVPAIWFFDRNLVEMALMNAIHNSLTYARNRIRISAVVAGPDLEVSVWDDSNGFPEHILQSFAENQPYRATGTGLGLQFARLIAQSHENRGRRGELRLGNAEGAVFSLLLP